MFGRKSAHFRNKQLPPCKETPGVYIAWERLRPKIGPVSDDLQHDAATFPLSTVQHCLLGEFRVKLEGIYSGYLHGAKVFQEFQLKELIGHQMFQFKFKITDPEYCPYFCTKYCMYSAPKLFVSD